MTPCPYCIGAERKAELDDCENSSLAAGNAARQTVLSSATGRGQQHWMWWRDGCLAAGVRARPFGACRDVFPAQVGGGT